MVRRDATASKGTYSKVGAPKETRPKGGLGVRACLTRCMILCISLVVILIMLALAGSRDADYGNDAYLRSGQAGEHPTTASRQPKKGKNIGSFNIEDDQFKVTEEDVNQAVEEVGLNLQIVEQEQIQEDTESILVSAVRVFGSYVRIGVAKMFTELTAEDIEEISEEIEEQVQEAVNKEYKEIADGIVEEEMFKIESMVDNEESNGRNSDLDIEEDVYSTSQKHISNVRHEIDDAAIEVTDAIKEKAAEIEKKVLEQRLSEKLGKTVKLVIVDDEVTAVNLDEMVNDLPTLTGQQQPYKPLGGIPQQQQMGTTQNYQQQQAPLAAKTNTSYQQQQAPLVAKTNTSYQQQNAVTAIPPPQLPPKNEVPPVATASAYP